MSAKRIKTTALCLSLVLLSALFLTGCKKSPEGVQILNYELSESGDAGKTYAGSMGVPEGESCPVVFVLHGAHAIEGDTPTPYYQGFEYLLRELAEKGYLAISIDINSAYTGDSMEGDEYSRIKNAFKASYDKLVLANEGKKVFPIDLKGKADLSKVNMIGHSRGGDNITQLIADPELRSISFVSALKIAAAGNSRLQENYADIPTAFIYSQYDEDVSDLASARYYYHAYGDEARRSPIISAFLYGGNHAAYNTLVNSSGLTSFGDEAKLLEGDSQRSFLKAFALDFLSVYNKDASLFQVFNSETQGRYGMNFMLSVHDPRGSHIVLPDEYKSGIQSENLRFEYLVSSKNELRNSAGIFNPPGTPEKLPLYKISWDKPGGSLTIPVDGMFYGINADKLLSLYIALDSGDGLNSPNKACSFDLVLTDAEGKEVSIPFSSEKNSALKYQPGKVLDLGESFAKWQAFTPLGTELIKLSDYKDRLLVDNIVSIKFKPSGETGAIMLAGIDVYPQS
ncbi:MAG: hypothetical protein RSB65_07430 [Oscillospiraceae bacterium]